MGRQEHGRSGGSALPDNIPYDAGIGRVEPARGLIEEQNTGAVQHGAGKVQAHLHALGVLAHAPVGGVGEAEPLEHHERVILGPWIKRREQLQILETGQLLIEAWKFERGSDAGSIRAVGMGRLDTGHRGMAGVTTQ